MNTGSKRAIFTSVNYRSQSGNPLHASGVYCCGLNRGPPTDCLSYDLDPDNKAIGMQVERYLALLR